MVSGGEWQTKFNVSPGPGLWSLVLGPFGPDLGPEPYLGPGPELDNWFLHYPYKDERCDVLHWEATDLVMVCNQSGLYLGEQRHADRDPSIAS